MSNDDAVFWLRYEMVINAPRIETNLFIDLIIATPHTFMASVHDTHTRSMISFWNCFFAFSTWFFFFIFFLSLPKSILSLVNFDLLSCHTQLRFRLSFPVAFPYICSPSLFVIFIYMFLKYLICWTFLFFFSSLCALKITTTKSQILMLVFWLLSIIFPK